MGANVAYETALDYCAIKWQACIIQSSKKKNSQTVTLNLLLIHLEPLLASIANATSAQKKNKKTTQDLIIIRTRSK